MNLDQNDEIYSHARRELRLGENMFRAITLLLFELQTSRSANLDQNDEIYLHARWELHPPKPGCNMDVRSTQLYFSCRSIQAPSKGAAKSRMEMPNHGCASLHPALHFRPTRQCSALKPLRHVQTRSARTRRARPRSLKHGGRRLWRRPLFGS